MRNSTTHANSEILSIRPRRAVIVLGEVLSGLFLCACLYLAVIYIAPIWKEVLNEKLADAITLTEYTAQFKTAAELEEEQACLEKAVHAEGYPFDEADQRGITLNILNRALKATYGGTTVCKVINKSGYNRKKQLVYQYTSMDHRYEPAPATVDSAAFTRSIAGKLHGTFVLGNLDSRLLVSTHYFAYYVFPKWGKLDILECKKRYLGMEGDHHHLAVIPVEDREACFAANQQEKQIAQIKADSKAKYAEKRRLHQQRNVITASYLPRKGVKIPVPAERPAFSVEGIILASF